MQPNTLVLSLLHYQVQGSLLVMQDSNSIISLQRGQSQSIFLPWWIYSYHQSSRDHWDQLQVGKEGWYEVPSIGSKLVWEVVIHGLRSTSLDQKAWRTHVIFSKQYQRCNGKNCDAVRKLVLQVCLSVPFHQARKPYVYCIFHSEYQMRLSVVRTSTQQAVTLDLSRSHQICGGGLPAHVRSCSWRVGKDHL